MDKRNSKKPEPDKKTDKQDRGDLKKPIENRNIRKTGDVEPSAKVSHADRGDSIKKLNRLDKTKAAVAKKVEEPKKTEDQHVSKEVVNKKVDNETLNRNNTLRDDKKKLRDKSTLKIKMLNAVPVTKKDMPVTVKKDIPNGVKKAATTIVHIVKPNLEVSTIKVPDHAAKKPNLPKDKADSKQASRDSVHTDSTLLRKPIIRTITSKNDSTKIYKAVTFVDHKKQKPTTIQVKLPEYKNQKASDTNTVCKMVPSTLSRVSVKEKVAVRKKSERRKNKRRRLVASPDLQVRVRSPPTEVAKWAPSSINKHTKPYYEAWVSTTLAAISKSSKKDKLFMEKQNILQSFQRALAARPETPDLVYENFTDERYTGRIKVKQR